MHAAIEDVDMLSAGNPGIDQSEPTPTDLERCVCELRDQHRRECGDTVGPEHGSNGSRTQFNIVEHTPKKSDRKI